MFIQDADVMLRLERAAHDAKQRWIEAMERRDFPAGRAAAREWTAADAKGNRYALANIEAYADR